MPAIRPARGENPYAKTSDWIAYCDLCGDEFTRQKSRLSGSDRCFCSRQCSIEYSRREDLGWRCTRCGKRLVGDQEGYCSDDCLTWATSWHQNYPEEQRSYSLRVGGLGALPFRGELWRERRLEALKRDGYRCRACGIPQRTHWRRYNTSLAVHHRIPRRQFDSADEAHALENLATLCSRCHGRAESDSVETAAQKFVEDQLDERIRAIVQEELEER